MQKVRASQTVRPSQKGYILLFTLGVLAVVAVLALGMSSSLRLDAQTVGKQKLRWQEQYALNGIVQYAAARISVAAQAKQLAAAKPMEPSARAKQWWPEEGPYSAEFAGIRATVHFDDAAAIVDANLLTEPEWQRLLLALGAANANAAAGMAKSIVLAKKDIAKRTGAGGFSSVAELLHSQALPQYVVRGVHSEARLALHELVLVGTDKKQLDVNRSPLPLFKVLAEFSDTQIGTLQSMRLRGAISVLEAQRLLAGSAVKAMTEKSDMVRVRVYLDSDDAGAGAPVAIALLKLENNVYKLVDQFIAQP